MRSASRLKQLYFAYFSRPKEDRVLYRAIGCHRPREIMQIGLGSRLRTLRMIELARRGSAGANVRFVLIDQFEARLDNRPGLSLKEAHRLLKPTGAKTQLIPGDPGSALARAANGLGQMDLVMISADHDEQSLADAWFYLPRLLHAKSQVFLECRLVGANSTILRLLGRDEIEALALSSRRKRAA